MGAIKLTLFGLFALYHLQGAISSVVERSSICIHYAVDECALPKKRYVCVKDLAGNIKRPICGKVLK